MSGITSGVGIFSGIDSKSIIDQLMALEARPKVAAQKRMLALQLQQTAYLDFNSRLDTIKRASKTFRDNRVFESASAASNNEDILTATASAGATTGTYQFIVDRLVSTQQMLGRGFGDSTVSGLGATSFTFESEQARLDRDVPLAELLGGAGVSRGKIVVTDSGSRTATIDLSKAATIGEVVDAINGNGTAQVTARVVEDKLVIRDNAGAAFSIANATGSQTATSLGIVGSGSATITGSALTTLSANTLLTQLNDGNGVYIRRHGTTTDYDFAIDVVAGGQNVNVKVNIGDVYIQEVGHTDLTKTKSAATTVGGVLERINTALTAAGATNVTASISSDGKRLQIVDVNGAPITVTDFNSSGSAAGLGIAGMDITGTIVGSRVVSGVATTLAASLNGGAGVGGSGVLNITARDGTAFSVNTAGMETLAEIARAIEDGSGTLGLGKRLSVSLNTKGTGLKITDNTGGVSNLIITGATGNDTAASLGISTGAGGVASATVTGTDLERQYMSRATALSSLNNGRGVGTGQFRITDGTGATALVNIGADIRNLGDAIDRINSSGLKIKAQLNDTGDGIIVKENVAPGQEGNVKIKIADVSGTVARSLNLAGESSATGAGNNSVNGTFERTIKFDATDTLATVVTKINSAGAGLTAGIVQDGGGAAPYRLSLTASRSGRSGRMIVDTNGFDLGLATMQAGEDSKVFYGSSDPAQALLITGSTNTLDNTISNVRIDLKAVSGTPVTVTVSRDTGRIESQIDEMVKGFNDLVDRIEAQTSYDKDTQRKGPLLGDGTTLELRAALFRTVQGRPTGVSGRYQNLAEVGIEVGEGASLTVNKDRLRAALTEDPAAVEAALTARVEGPLDTPTLPTGVTANDPNARHTFTSLGVFSGLEELATRYIDSTRGILLGRKNTIDLQLKSQNDQIAAMDVRLASRRLVLEGQFLRMEKAIGQLQGQQSSLSSIK